MVIIVIYSILLLACIIAFIMLIISRAKKKKNGLNKSTTNGKNLKDKSITEILPFDCYDDGLDCFRYKDGTYMDLLQVRTKDLTNEARDSVEYDILKFTKLYKKFDGDIKIVATNFPSDTSKQQEYIRHKISKTKNSEHKKWLQKSLDELIWIEENRTSREFYYMFWGNNEKEIIKRRDIFINTLGTTKDGLLHKPMDKNKKIAICRKLNNKNAHILKRGDR